MKLWPKEVSFEECGRDVPWVLCTLYASIVLYVVMSLGVAFPFELPNPIHSCV